VNREIVRHVGEPSDPSSPAGTPQSIGEVKFRRTLRGYHAGDVDSFLEDVAARLRRGEVVTARQVSEAKFRQTLKGYDIKAVDAYLDALAEAFGR
jgi:DivIVA domain-containing protein